MIVKGNVIPTYVASFTDAWIETRNDGYKVQILTSHLLQMRGLKQSFRCILPYKDRSHLLQMRGLKPGEKRPLVKRYMVASFTDAWIETSLDK